MGDLLVDTITRSLLGLDVQSLCAALAVSRAWREAACGQNEAAWEIALLAPQVPAEEPGCYETTFTQDGIRTLQAILAQGIGSEAMQAARYWSEKSSLRKLALDYSLRRAAHFVRLAHSGVEAETLVLKGDFLHVTLEVLNFFPCPVWVGLCCGQPPHGTRAAEIDLKGYAHGTSCGERPEKYFGGSVMICQVANTMPPEPRQHFIYCAPFSRTEVGEHVLDAWQGTALHFVYARHVEVLGISLETLPVDVRSSGDPPGTPVNEVLIPTTRAHNCSMSSAEWQRRGAPVGGDDDAPQAGRELMLNRAVHGESPVLWNWDVRQAVPVELVDVLYAGRVSL